ncbi:neutral amino acid permease [Fusarium acutatum]|uniref:Neutral amino acid permease n=1 Tax=Fusarium acutatum TaxID=78861 RepID=A0A8H4JGB9_9HYPO|nr:neutral amino acid permease [Fusarium acutatum]
MNSYNINSTAEEGNDLALTPSQLNKPDNEASLHHDAVFGEISDEGPDYRSVGLIGTAGLMMKTQIGLGVLSIPATFNALGMIPGIICLLAVAVITTWSNWIVGLFKLRHRHVYAIDDAGEMMFGVVGKEFFGFAMWIYWVFVSGAGMLSLSIGLNAVSSHGACTAVFVAVAAVLGFGLSSIRTLARMSWLAWIGVISIMISVIMVTIATGVQERPAAAPQDGVWVSDYKLFNKPSFVQAASAICSLVSAFGGTPGFFAIVAEMRRPEQYTKALTICQAIVTVTYLTIGCVMYYFCGSYVSSPALGSAGDTIKKASYGVAIPGLIVSITLVTHLPSKYMFVRLLRNTKHLASNSAVHWSTWLGCTFIVSIIAYIIASAIPIFYSLISLIGALVGTLMCFQTMGFMWFYDNWEKRAISPKWLSACGWSVFVIASGTLLMVAGTYGSIVDIIQAYKAAGGSGAWSQLHRKPTPDDEDAQWRAQTATALLQDCGITPQAPTSGSSRITSASPSEPKPSVKLPAELYGMIVGYSLHYFNSLRSNGGGQDRIGVADARKHLSDWISGHTRVKQSLKQLETLGLDGPSGWLLQGSLQYPLRNLTSLQLGWETVLDFSRTPLFDISQQCQKLKVLVVLYKLVTTDDLEKACRAWASTLKTLKFDQVAENQDWISKVIPHLRKLKVLFLGRLCYVFVDSINAVAKAEMSLEWISIVDVEGLLLGVQVSNSHGI